MLDWHLKLIELACFFLVWEREAARHPLLLLPEFQQREKEKENRRGGNLSLHLLRDDRCTNWQWSELWRSGGEEGKVLLANIHNAWPRLLPADKKAADATVQLQPQLSIQGKEEVDSRGSRLRQPQLSGLLHGLAEAVRAWPFGWAVELCFLHLLQQQPVALLWNVRVPTLLICCRVRYDLDKQIILSVLLCLVRFYFLLIHKIHFTDCKTNWIPFKKRDHATLEAKHLKLKSIYCFIFPPVNINRSSLLT